MRKGNKELAITGLQLDTNLVYYSLNHILIVTRPCFPLCKNANQSKNPLYSRKFDWLDLILMSHHGSVPNHLFRFRVIQENKDS
jgi:hypothetical protein